MGTERTWDMPETMIGVDDARERILARFAPLEAVATPIVDALGMVAARNVVSTVDVPPFRNSAMDGYAVRSIDVADAPVVLRVTGTVAAGTVPDRAVGPGESMRIMTGAPIPAGADAVVRFEETDESSRANNGLAEIEISRPVQARENVREAGEDVRAGDAVISAGTVLGPAEIGILASLNMATVDVHRRPRVAILSTGDEVVDLGPDLQPGQIRNSNSHTIAALVRQAGGEPVLLGVARDTTDDVHDKLFASDTPDLFVTSGGVSVGDYDVVKNVLKAEGSIDVWQVRMKPGKPLAFGTIGNTPLLGLPGNPVAALVSFEQFGRPAIRRMLGHSQLSLPELDAISMERLPNPGRRRHFVRGVVSRTSAYLEARPTGDQGSAVLMAAVRANCFIIVPETSDVIDPGTTVRVQLFDGTLIT